MKQTKYVVMMNKEDSTKIVNFIQVIIVNMYFFLLHQYTSHWLHYDAAFLYNCCFLVIIIMELRCKYVPFWQEFSVKSLMLRWPLRPVDLLFLWWKGLCRKCSKSLIFINSIRWICIQYIFIYRGAFLYAQGIFETGFKK